MRSPRTIRTAGDNPAVCLLQPPETARPRIVRAVSLALAVSIALIPYSSSAAAADMIIGVAGPMSGPLAEAGEQYAAAVKFAADKINAGGGLNGNTLKVIIADDQATPKIAIKAARGLAALNASIVIGHYNSTPALAANDIYLKNNILVVSPQAIISKLTSLKAWNIIRLSPRADAQANAAADFLTSGSANPKIALVHDNSAFARALAAKATGRLSQRGLKPALTGEVPADTRHTASIVSRLAGRIAKAGIESVYWTGSSAGAKQLLTAMRRQKSRAVFIGSDVLAAPAFAKTKNPDALDGARMTLAPGITGTKNAGEFLQELGIKQSGEEAAPAVAAYAAIQIIAAAAKVAKSNDPRRLAKTLRSGQVFQTIIGPMSFNAKGDRRETLYKIYRWTKAEDGKLIFGEDAPKSE